MIPDVPGLRPLVDDAGSATPTLDKALAAVTTDAGADEASDGAALVAVPVAPEVDAAVADPATTPTPTPSDDGEPDVAAVLTVTGQLDTYVLYGAWTAVLGGKDARGVLAHAVVEGAGHAWEGKAQCIPEEVEKWLDVRGAIEDCCLM